MNAAVLGDVVLEEADDGSTALQALRAASLGGHNHHHGNTTSNTNTNKEAEGDVDSSSQQENDQYISMEMGTTNSVNDNGMMMQTAEKGEVDLDEGGGDDFRRLQNNTGFDVVFIDYVMTKMNGPEAVQIMRRDLKYTGGIIGVTGNALPSDLTYFKECGADLVITKPLTNKKLMDAVHSVVAHSNQGNRKNRMA